MPTPTPPNRSAYVRGFPNTKSGMEIARDVKASHNTVGLIGFILSLVSLVSCIPPLAIPALIVSAFGLRHEAKGFAIAGIVISSLTLVVIGGFALWFIGFIGGTYGGGHFMAGLEIMSESGQIQVAIDQQGSTVPTEIDKLGLDEDTTTDPWGQPYRILVPNPRGGRWALLSLGPDTLYDTPDDIIIEPD